MTKKQSSTYLDDKTGVDNEITYPELGYFEMAKAINNLKDQQKTTKGSRMSAVWIFFCLSKNERIEFFCFFFYLSLWLRAHEFC